MPCRVLHDLMLGQDNPASCFPHMRTCQVLACIKHGKRVLSDQVYFTFFHSAEHAHMHAGNSGGPLLDSSGCVIGITTAIYSSSGQNSGVGFAIPTDVVRENLHAHGQACALPTLLNGPVGN
eukprot:scaffold164388_cov22-Tisochrysis_lutea.AAC.1